MVYSVRNVCAIGGNDWANYLNPPVRFRRGKLWKVYGMMECRILTGIYFYIKSN